MSVPHRLLPTTFNNVDRNTFDDLYESILNSVRNASYLSLDNEFASLGKAKNANGLFEQYECHKEAAEKYTLLSFGLTVVQKVNNNTEKDVHYKVDNYNFTTLKRNGFFVDSGTCEFLTRNDFSFDDLLLNGIEFEPMRKSTDSKYSKLSKLWHEMIHIMNKRGIPLMVHIEFLDMVYIYESFIGILPDTVSRFLHVLAVTFTAGIFDTKYISTKVAKEQRSFLAFLFKKYDRLLEYRFNTDKIHFKFESKPPIIPNAVDITCTTTTTTTIATTIHNSNNITSQHSQSQHERASDLLTSSFSSASSLPYCEEFAISEILYSSYIDPMYMST